MINLLYRIKWWLKRKLQTPPMCECGHDMSFHTEYDSIGCITCWESYVMEDNDDSDCPNYFKGDPWL